MAEWSQNPDTPDLYWMDGMAGTGKTTIACSFSNKLEERKQLAASFFCTRTSHECRQVSRIIPTIAYQLARYSTPFQVALCDVLGNEPDIGSKNVAKQVERLLKEPLLRVREAIPDNLIVVIDALDECEDRHGVKLVLDLLFKFAPILPLKFFVTSRPEPEIYERMIIRNRNSREVIHLHEIEKSLVKADIELYLREELSFMSPTDDEINQLVGRSGNLFIYAATLVRYIRPAKRAVDPQRRLWSALAITSESTGRYAEVDALYTAVLKSVLDEEDLDTEESEDVRVVLQTVLCGQEPVGVETLTALAGMKTSRQTLSALQLLRSVVHFSDSSGLVSIFHASFPDFMFDKERSGPFFCDAAKRNELVARRCFEVMKGQLRFNICNLESSFIPDCKVPNLDDRIKKAISPTLLYTCRYWGDHLRLAGHSDELCTALDDFLSIRLLFWMEVLNLKREMGLGIQILVMAKIWLQVSRFCWSHSAANLRYPLLQASTSPSLAQFIEDAQNFATSYTANPISQSTPHIYVSSLPLCPRSSFIFQHYQKRTQGMVELTGAGMEQRETAALASWEIAVGVWSVAYSPDGSRVAFGCKDGTVGVQNAYDGTSIVAPFKAHTREVLSVVFSPDGTRFLSGSLDTTIRMWNGHDGSPLDVSFQGYTGGVYVVTFSPDGSRIAAGCGDRTVRVWRATDGTPVGSPLEGRPRWVGALAFSPDGTRVVSGSGNYLQVWGIDNGPPHLLELEGHTAIVHSVAFSPDGTLIASGSADHTIRVWHSGTGLSAVDPLKGHTGEIQAVAFSPDGTRIVSGSGDATLRVWSSHTGTLVAGPFGGHTDKVLSVAFSPDGIRVASSSFDGTIRVWNARDGLPVPRQFEGHTNGVWSVAVSPDGTRIVSASSDFTLRLWSTRDGTHITNSFKGHTERVWSAAFLSNGTRVVSSSADRSIRMWNTHDGTLVPSPLMRHTDAVYSIAVSPSGLIASGSADHTLQIWDSLSSKLVAGPLKGHTNVVFSVSFSSDGTCIVSGSYDHTVRVWSAPKGNPLAGPFCGHSGWVTSVAFSPDSVYVASGSQDCTIRLWSAQTGTSIIGPFMGHTDEIYSVAFSPDGTYIASGSKDRTIRFWSVRDGTLIAGPFCGHTQLITSLAFVPDGKHLVSGSIDYSIRMWDMSGVLPSASALDTFSTNASHSPIVDGITGSSFGDWGVTANGWITSKDGRLLFWAPIEVLRSLLTPHCKFIINRSGPIEINFTQALLGDQWHKCYTSV